MRRPVWGMIQGGVRWNTCSRATSGWMAGTNWIADAPVPITATRSPARSWPWSQRAEWKAAPAKRSSPGMAGTLGSVSGPMPAIRTRALSVPAEVATIQRPAASSHAADSTLVPSRIERYRSWRAAQLRR